MKRWLVLATMLVGVIVIILMSIHTHIASLGLIGIVFLLLIAMRNPLMPILMIISIFSLFPFLAVLWPVVAEAKYTVIKEGLYLIVLTAGYLRYKSGSIKRHIAWGSSCIVAYGAILILFWVATAPDWIIGLISLRDHIAFLLLALVIPKIIRSEDPKRILMTILSLTSLIALTHMIDFGVTYQFTFARGASRTLFKVLNPNVLGTLYATQLAILISLWRYLIKGSRHKILMQGLLLSAAFTLSSALVVTLSRRSMLALLFAIPLGFWLLNRSVSITRRMSMLIIGALIVLFMLQHVPEPVRARLRLHNIIQEVDVVDVLRREELRTFGSDYLSNISVLLIGSGFGLVGSANLLRSDFDVYFHNYYIILLSDSGIIGLGLFIFSVGIILLRPLFRRYASHETEPLVSAIFQGLLVILISNLFGTTLMTIPVNVFFWCYIGVMIYLLSPYKAKSYREPK